jgi:hypothetical protein
MPSNASNEPRDFDEPTVGSGADVLPEEGVNDPDAENATRGEPNAAFRTPTPGARLTAGELENDVEDA